MATVDLLEYVAMRTRAQTAERELEAIRKRFEKPSAWMNEYGCVISDRAHEDWGTKDLTPPEQYNIPLYK